MIFHREDTSELIKFWRREFVRDFIGLLVNKTWRIGAECAKSALLEGTGKGKSPLQIYNVGVPFESSNKRTILGPLSIILSENKYLLIVVDCFTK